ncbi:hypothetical protein IMSHALPRED_002059 [Imshaugia aleurites]|uniref:RGS domain-containing protein n=1 Tax=Imshaugia aleurites TaxID=172621 RepID=A0A8H3PGT4_9LECA|nr:hypothetical protein IMSHALPRED_002059 [Imshaugia aleurites]
MSILFYKRPEYVLRHNGPLAECSRKGGTAQDCSTAAIPPELSFENVICNKCLPPCSLQDFLDYLTYVTHDAENLQFYLWMVDYFQRFRNAPKSEKELSPPWKNDPSRSACRINNQMPVKGSTPLVTREIDLHSEDISNGSTWDGDHSEEFGDDYSQTQDPMKFGMSPTKTLVKHSYEKYVPPKWQVSPRNQPFRSEINRIVNHYIVPGSPRELNLSHNDRATVLRALEHTTHPSALTLVKRMLDSTLRNQSHPNFVRWSICNGNKQWTVALRAFAIMNIVVGFAIAIVLTLSKYSRWWRIFASFEWWFGTTNIIAASQGLCVLLHRMHTRQHHAWETKDYTQDDDEAMLKALDINFINYESTKSKWPVKMEVFGPANSYGAEPWVNHYSRKSWWRKLFERRIPVQENGLKAIQNRMIRQAEAWALLITIPLTIAFVAIPKGNLYPS